MRLRDKLLLTAGVVGWFAVVVWVMVDVRNAH
jgi:hypothetical protein